MTGNRADASMAATYTGANYLATCDGHHSAGGWGGHNALEIQYLIPSIPPWAASAAHFFCPARSLPDTAPPRYIVDAPAPEGQRGRTKKWVRE